MSDATTTEIAPPTRTRRRRDPNIRALAVFVRALERQNPDAVRAAILWLADRYLGMKPRDWGYMPPRPR